MRESGRMTQRGWLLGLAGAAGLFALITVLFAPRLLYPPLSAADLKGVVVAEKRVELRQAQSQLENSVRLLLLQGFGGLILIAGAMATWQQLQVSREGQITDRYIRAVDQLGSAKPEVRIGGLFALERVAKNSEVDRAAITEVLTAFIRSGAPWVPKPGYVPAEIPVDQHVPWLRERTPDIQAALTVLGRTATVLPDGRGPDLSHVDLHRSYLSGAKRNE